MGRSQGMGARLTNVLERLKIVVRNQCTEMGNGTKEWKRDGLWLEGRGGVV